jgi:hypothetical protein
MIKEGVYYCAATDSIYEGNYFNSLFLMHNDLFGTMFMDASFFNNPDNGWFYLGGL